MRTPLKRSLRMYDEPGKEEKKRLTSKNEEEMDKINGQIRALEEEKKKIEEGRIIGSGKPKIISDIQIIPPRGMEQDIMPQEQQQDEAWKEVGNRRGKQNGKDEKRDRVRGRERSISGTRQRRPPKAAVVAIRTKNDKVSYADVLKKARQEIPPGEIGIEVTKIRRDLNGSVIIEIPGQESSEKAKILADKLKEKLSEEEVAISRPVTMAEIRITGLDESD